MPRMSRVYHSAQTKLVSIYHSVHQPPGVYALDGEHWTGVHALNSKLLVSYSLNGGLCKPGDLQPPVSNSWFLILTPGFLFSANLMIYSRRFLV